MTVSTGFAISVPASWFEIEVHPDTRNASIGALVSERTRAVPELSGHREALARALRSAARSAYANGAAYCGAMAEGFDGAVLTASVTVAVVRSPSAEAEINAYLRPLARTGENSPWREVGRIDLPHIGGVACTRGVEDVVLPEGGGWVRAVLMQTFIPFPEPGPEGGDRHLALVTGSTPILQMAEEFLDLFEAITTTFRFVSHPG